MPSMRCARDGPDALRTSRTGSGLPACGALGAALLAALSCGPASTPLETGGLSSGQAAGAVVITAIAAGTLWLAGGGCRLQGCPYGSYCNKETGYCDVRKCEDGCPDGTICNEGLGRC